MPQEQDTWGSRIPLTSTVETFPKLVKSLPFEVFPKIAEREAKNTVFYFIS